MKKTIFIFLLTLLLPVYGFSQTTDKLQQVVISGETIKLGQGADIVQSRIKADRYISAGYNYGDLGKGYYTDKGITYIITYGPPQSNTGGYVVKKIEKVIANKPAIPPKKDNSQTKKPLLKTNTKQTTGQTKQADCVSTLDSNVCVGESHDSVVAKISKLYVVSQKVTQSPQGFGPVVEREYNIHGNHFFITFGRTGPDGPHRVLKIKTQE